ncbi:methylmalonyl-CoA mutase family protein [Methylopila sp. Yamaguchi]|uniref:methylmalonyl-CoA mutase family protein n=1 Tax=Methylopila sp. Yamaguchi TaxID=1437817 RepID=UPI000CCB5B2D|nr:methylmalonyl-CoA mutase family protein [Methylopila sp. Yamaguchi]GBD49119.1 methylmalonyl-CoA mutase small subunit [Methylopila sp. Yamaguchi]
MTNQTTEAAMTRVATSFAADFAPATEEDWRAAAEAALKGRPLESVIRHRTMDGVAVAAIRPRSAASPIPGRAPGARWISFSRIDIADPAAANAQALEDLNNGAAGLALAFLTPGDGHGVAADTLDRLDQALEGVLLDLAPLYLEVVPFEGRTAAALVAALIERRGVAPSDTFICFGVDLLRDLVRTGTLPRSWNEMGARIAGVVEGLRTRGFMGPVFSIDARVAHGAGATNVQELAGALASATEHVRALVANGVDLEAAADAMSFAFSCDADQFATIAKLRAARLLWAAWRRESGLPERTVHIHAETSRRMMSERAAHTNLVRTTIAAFAAGVGGADSVTVRPFTDALGTADADARRLARNAQAIILEESNAHRVADPAAGAGAIDGLTDALAETAWMLFQQIEREGGLLQALTSGSWQTQIADARARRRAAVATRRSPVVGVSEFPEVGETLYASASPPQISRSPHVVPIAGEISEDLAGFDALVAAFLNGSSFADVRAASAPNPSVSATPLDLERVAAPFERLRAANEAASPRPTVYLALVGPIAKHSGRAGFVRNLLAAGGLAAIDGPVGATSDADVAAWRESGARLAIICGADDGYAETGPGLAAALAAAGATVWLAGRPKEGAEALSAAGVGRFVAAGDDALAVLHDATTLASAQTAPTLGGVS